MFSELEDAYNAMASSWGSREGDGSRELTDAFIDQLVYHLPDISNQNFVKCINATILFILSNTGKLPSRPETRGELKKLVETCEAMDAAFDSTSPYTNFLLQLSFSLDPNFNPVTPALNVKQFTAHFKLFTRNIRNYMDTLLVSYPSRGPHKDFPTEQLIRQLALSYEATTGKLAKRGVIADGDHKGFHGEFFELVLGCIKALGKEYHSKDALGGRIRRVLNKMNKKA